MGAGDPPARGWAVKHTSRTGSTAGLPRIVAHRGVSAEYPENTLPAFRAAADTPGVWGMELDVQLSRDGQAMVHHDHTLERLGEPDKRVRDLTARELVNLGDGEPIPALPEVLAAVPDGMVLVELKVFEEDLADHRHHRLADCVISCISTASAQAQTWFLSFDRGVLAYLRAGLPDVPRMWNRRGWEDTWPGAWADGLSAVDFDITHLDARAVQRVGQRGLSSFVYTCNSETEVDAAMAAGVNGIISDRPGWVVEYLGGGR